MSAVPSVISRHQPPWLTPLIRGVSESLGYPLLGLGILLAIWWTSGYLIASNPSTQAFSGFAPGQALPRAWELVTSGTLAADVTPSLKRIGQGLLFAAIAGIPTGVLVGWIPTIQRITNFPFQLLRMVSPLAWMPVAVLAFDTWDGSIVFLIFMAAVWPILFSTAFAVQRIDPMFFKVANNFGASVFSRLRRLVLPAIAPDILAGFRLALGIAWVVLVPAEYLGVSSGLGYAINDARDILAYDLLAALVLVIGVIGYVLDSTVVMLMRYFGWKN